jgi:RNA methyltransferase, TrmH family
MVRITSRQNAVVARYRALARGDSRTEMLLDGPHLVADALAARVPIRHATAVSDDGGPSQAAELIQQIADRGIEIAYASRMVMEAVSPVRSASAIVAIAERPQHRVEDLFSPDAVTVIACDVQDPGNLGAIIRVAEAAGAAGVVAAGMSADPFGWKALRGSMGSALRLAVAHAPQLQRAMDLAAQRGCRTVAMVPRGGEPLFDADLGGGLALLIGREGAGLPATVTAGADLRVTIPMQAPVESLNAAVAAALVLFEARRQRSFA